MDGRGALLWFVAVSCAGCDFGIFAVRDGGGELPDAEVERDAGPRIDSGPPMPVCAGMFGVGTRVLDDVGLFQSPAVTEDELEIFYGAAMAPGGPQELRVSRRDTTTVNFPVGRRLEEVEAHCAVMAPAATGRTVDVSRDGLDLYVSCHDTAMPTDYPLIHFHRPDRTQPFVFVANLANVYCCASISPDERELYWSDFAGTARIATRAAPGEPFGVGAAVPGLETLVARSPDLAPDGSSLFAAQAPANHVLEFPRSGTMSFSTPAIEHAVLPTATAIGGPDITPDCRRLYFAASVSDPLTGLTTQDVYVSVR